MGLKDLCDKGIVDPYPPLCDTKVNDPWLWGPNYYWLHLLSFLIHFYCHTFIVLGLLHGPVGAHDPPATDMQRSHQPRNRLLILSLSNSNYLVCFVQINMGDKRDYLQSLLPTIFIVLLMTPRYSCWPLLLAIKVAFNIFGSVQKMAFSGVGGNEYARHSIGRIFRK